MTDDKSPRSQAAETIQSFILDNDLAQVFGGDIAYGPGDRKIYREIGFSLRSTLDGSVRVFSATKIEVRSEGSHGDGVVTFGTVESVLAYMKARWVDFDQEAADAVPRWAPKGRAD